MSDLQVRGPLWGGSGTPSPFTAMTSGSQRVSDSHGRFMDAALGGRLFTFGLSNTALVAANAIATGLTATAQPIIGLYNPATSLVNLSVLQAIIQVTTVANTAVAPGGFMWVYSIGNNGVTSGSSPINCKTFQSAGSVAKAFAVSTALTGLSNNLAALRSSAIVPAVNAAGAATAVSLAQGNGVENVDGGLVIPPGGVLGIMCQLATTTINVSVGIVWEEVPNLP